MGINIYCYKTLSAGIQQGLYELDAILPLTGKMEKLYMLMVSHSTSAKNNFFVNVYMILHYS